MKRLFEKVKKENNGRLDVLVNNAYAGVDMIYKNTGKKFYELDPVEQWDTINGVGLRNHFLCTTYASRWKNLWQNILLKGRVTPSPRSPLFSILFSSLKNGVRKTRPFLECKIRKTQKKFSKIFIVPNRPKYHTDQLYTYKGYVDSVGFTEKRQKLSKWHISLIFDLF